MWDAFGRLLYQSTPFDHVISSIAWNPSGQMFAVGSFNSVALCDSMGWAHAKVRKDAVSDCIHN